MLAEIQVQKKNKLVYALDESYNIIACMPCSTDFYPGYNEYGQPRGNAENGVYRDANVWAQAGRQEPAYGNGYINIDDRGRALHGGGSNLEDPYEDFQPLLPTYGCFRLRNADIEWLAKMFVHSCELGLKPCIHVVD